MHTTDRLRWTLRKLIEILPYDVHQVVSSIRSPQTLILIYWLYDRVQGFFAYSYTAGVQWEGVKGLFAFVLRF